MCFSKVCFLFFVHLTPVAAQCDPTDTIGLVSPADLELPPRFPGGEAALLKFLLGAQYPPLDSTQEVIGKLTVSFIVEVDGRVSNICPLRHPDHPWTLALIRHLAGVPPFLPGEKAGRAVRTRFNLPGFIHLD